MTDLENAVYRALVSLGYLHGTRQAAEVISVFVEAEAARATAEQSTDAARDVLAERRRQIEVECWAPGRDDTVHQYGELADAAACYAHHSGMRSAEGLMRNSTEPFTFWPWASEWWKPTTPRRDLVKAGALILAEIERLDRVAAIESQRSGDGS